MAEGGERVAGGVCGSENWRKEEETSSAKDKCFGAEIL
jgi:hypothetical protein